MGDNIITDHIALGLVILVGITFGTLWKKFDFFGFWSAIIFLIILIILWIAFF